MKWHISTVCEHVHEGGVQYKYSLICPWNIAGSPTRNSEVHFTNTMRCYKLRSNDSPVIASTSLGLGSSWTKFNDCEWQRFNVCLLWNGQGNKTIEEHFELIDGLLKLGEHSPAVAEETENAYTTLVSLLYIERKEGSLNKVRYERHEPFAKKNKTSDRLLPTMDAFRMHLNRANFQAFI